MNEDPSRKNARVLNLSQRPGGLGSAEAYTAMQDALGMLSSRALRGDQEAQRQRDTVINLWNSKGWGDPSSSVGSEVWEPEFEKAMGGKFADWVFRDTPSTAEVSWDTSTGSGRLVDTRGFSEYGMPGYITQSNNDAGYRRDIASNWQEGRDTVGRSMGIVPGKFNDPNTQAFVSAWNRENPDQALNESNYMDFYSRSVKDRNYRPGQVTDPAYYRGAAANGAAVNGFLYQNESGGLLPDKFPKTAYGLLG